MLNLLKIWFKIWKFFWLIEQIICPPGPLNRERCVALFGHVVLWLVRLKITPLEVRKRDVGVLLDYQYSVGFISSEYFDYEQNLRWWPNDDHFDQKIVNLLPKIVFMWAVESVSVLLRYLSKYYFKKTTVLFDVNLDLCIHGLNYRKLAQNWKEHKCSFII